MGIFNLPVIGTGSEVRSYPRLEKEIIYVRQSPNCIYVSGLNVIVRVIEQVVELRPELKTGFFGYCEGLVYSEIEVPVTGLAELIA